MLINETTWKFIKDHANDDVRKVALKGAKDLEVDLTMALQQIAGKQTARQKLPTWAAVEGIVYPPHLNMEQCSSEQTARYKALLTGNGQRFVDLTGGFGVDFYWISQGYEESVYIEKNPELCAISSENFRLLNRKCEILCLPASAYLNDMPHASLVYLDPARRNEHGGRTYSIADCSPNVLELMPLLIRKADRVMLKLSPMLDWRQAVKDIEGTTANGQLAHVTHVHIVSVDNECKEMIIQMENTRLANEQHKMNVVCVNLLSNGGQQAFVFGGQPPFSTQTEDTTRSISTISTLNPRFLYEPNASIMKAGCFEAIEKQYGAHQVAFNSHLFLSSDEIADFPGRQFTILSISSMNKNELNQKLATMKRANIAVRNFPLSAEQLRKKLKLKEGGDDYLFASTAQDGRHLLYICRKIR